MNKNKQHREGYLVNMHVPGNMKIQNRKRPPHRPGPPPVLRNENEEGQDLEQVSRAWEPVSSRVLDPCQATLCPQGDNS